MHDPRRRDFWGNPVVHSWYKDATEVLDLDGAPVPLTESGVDESVATVGADGLGTYHKTT